MRLRLCLMVESLSQVYGDVPVMTPSTAARRLARLDARQRTHAASERCENQLAQPIIRIHPRRCLVLQAVSPLLAVRSPSPHSAPPTAVDGRPTDCAPTDNTLTMLAPKGAKSKIQTAQQSIHASKKKQPNDEDKSAGVRRPRPVRAAGRWERQGGVRR